MKSLLEELLTYRWKQGLSHRQGQDKEKLCPQIPQTNYGIGSNNNENAFGDLNSKM